MLIIIGQDNKANIEKEKFKNLEGNFIILQIDKDLKAIM